MDQEFASTFGCDYCADDQNRLYGHVTQIGSSENRRMLLLRCPHCGTLYENSVRGEDETRRLTEDEAEHLFSSSILLRRLAEDHRRVPFPSSIEKGIDYGEVDPVNDRS